MPPLDEVLGDIIREHEFSGVVRVDRGDETVFAAAYGLANRSAGLSNSMDTMFGLASGTKGITALVIASLLEDGVLDLSTMVRVLLGDDLPLINDAVTIEHLLSHRSGIGDYLDEDLHQPITDYLMPVPVHELDSTEAYLAVLDGHPAKFAPGERFSYCNSGYVVLALIAERASGMPFDELVRRRVCQPAGMVRTRFLRSDEVPGDAAIGYLQIDGAWRTNVFHLPVLGSGDGGIYSTVADIRKLWTAMFDEAIVSKDFVAELVKPRSDVPSESRRYGMGFWLHRSRDVVMLEGMDAGVSFRTVHDPRARLSFTVISNTFDGAWPLVKCLEAQLIEGAAAG
jgi:CubicO group peptidase (beta-lactamase class C family)